MLTTSECTTLFNRIADLRIGVIGDFALDLYYAIQTQTGEQSLETGLDVFWGSRPRSSLGGAGNVVQNLVALGTQYVQVVGCIGNDLFGREMQSIFERANVNTQHLYTPATGWDTCVYTKPMRGNQEMNRIDFGIHNELADAFFIDLMAGLEQALSDLDVLIINQQFENPLLSENRVGLLNNLIARFPQVRFIVDMRHVGKYIQGTTLKVNTAELARFLGIDLPCQPDLDWCIQHGKTFMKMSRGPLVITRGEQGILYLDDHETQWVDGFSLIGELDTVGAGDTVVAAFAACIGAGATPAQAIEMANLAAAVTVQKVGQTGTATLPELLALKRIYDPHEQGKTTAVSSGTA